MTGDTWQRREGVKWDRASRYLRILAQLRTPGGITAAEIANRIGVSKRTVFRDLQAMSDEMQAGLPIWQEGGRWGIDESAFLPPLNLTLHEAATFVLAARVLAKARDERDPELISAYAKLAEIVPDVLAEHLRETVDAYTVIPADERFTRVFRELTRGWAERRVVQIEYRRDAYDPGKGTQTRRVRPHAIEPSATTRALYLIGFDETVGARRTFKIERIVNASVTPETFDDPQSDIARDLLLAWDVVSDQPQHRIVVRFSPEVAARAAETRWHPSQETETEADGSLLWSARVAGLQEVRGWVLSWGGEAEVLEPAELRDWVGQQVERMGRTYG